MFSFICKICFADFMLSFPVFIFDVFKVLESCVAYWNYVVCLLILLDGWICRVIVHLELEFSFNLTSSSGDVWHPSAHGTQL